jgi:hypothetical protein
MGFQYLMKVLTSLQIKIIQDHLTIKKNISETWNIFKFGGFFLLASKQDSIRTIYTF